MKLEYLQKDFLSHEFFVMSWSGASQHNRIYRNGISEKQKVNFRCFLFEKIRKIAEKYKGKVEEDEHVKNIQGLKNSIELNYRDIINESSISFGTCQKLVNLYLKYLWVDRQITIPPHCPIDSKILGLLGKKKISWTKVEIDEYKGIIADIKKIIPNRSIAEWELEKFEEIRIYPPNEEPLN